ncbi:DUF3180 family protein [Microbacterium sp.]|uniref:DUF3180 family protein n=1 Tax=Microbacterium sp. TaxID=51671 RepID=UPI003A8C27EF
MRRTSAGLLIAVGVVAAIVGFVVDQTLTASGRPTFTPSLMLPVLLVLLGAITVALAVPIRRATRGAGGYPVDPFRAVRIAMLAKASSIVGAGVAGVGLGLATFLVSRPVPPGGSALAAVIAAAVGGVVLVVAGLVAERMCTIGSPGDDDELPPPEPGVTPSHH